MNGFVGFHRVYNNRCLVAINRTMHKMIIELFIRGSEARHFISFI